MPGINVIADVTETLTTFLTAALNPVLGAEAVESDFLDETLPTGKKVAVFLYEVIEDPSVRNRPRVREPLNGSVKINKPPVALLLRYLVTPLATGDKHERTNQQLLGVVIKTFAETPILAGSDLQGELKNSPEALKLTLSPLSLEDRTRIWSAVHHRYRLSLTYEVRVVNLSVDSGLEAPLVNQRDVAAGGIP